MNTIDLCRLVEEQGMQAIAPLLRSLSDHGQFTVINKGPLVPILQATIGDVTLNHQERFYSIEVKTEQHDDYGNFFFETWSNKNFSRRKLGWMLTLIADVFWYYFLDCDCLYSINLRRLWEWAFIENRIYDFEEKEQAKHRQLNRTFGRCVPISVIKAEVGYRLYHPQQSFEPVEEQAAKKSPSVALSLTDELEQILRKRVHKAGA